MAAAWVGSPDTNAKLSDYEEAVRQCRRAQEAKFAAWLAAHIPKAPDAWSIIEEFADGSVWLRRTTSDGKTTTWHARLPESQVE